MQDEKTSILYLDDEENNLTAFKASFRRNFTVHITSRADEAVNILKQNKVHLIVADQKMPDISGVEFLELVRSEFPDPIRILLTGYADIEAVIDAINRGQVYRYITKPWDEQELRMVFTNAREHYDTKTQLKAKNEELSKAFKDLKRFVYSASHDLRAPLASIRSITELAKSEAPTQDNNYIGMIETNVVKLDYFTQNLINFYQNLSDELRLENVEFPSLLDEVLNKSRHFIADKEVAIRTSDVLSHLRTDRNRLAVILGNLLVNAFIHGASENKPVQVNVSLIEWDTDFVLKVSDNGQGIAPQKLKEIHEMLKGVKEHESGFGMGLYIVREVTRTLGGSIELNSGEGNGTEVVITLPKNNG